MPHAGSCFSGLPIGSNRPEAPIQRRPYEKARGVRKRTLAKGWVAPEDLYGRSIVKAVVSAHFHTRPLTVCPLFRSDSAASRDEFRKCQPAARATVEPGKSGCGAV